ncbi:MAG: YafY family transcriptional regulator [Deltaproteobacteria bacterium]|nr:YafY family transcriptional regulator [Deltaproteobacteria bacterium]MBN2672532.1 YafY family transcriptional regulator [Deltaproteobacteria bacterium]
MKIDRLLSIVLLLLKRKKITAPELAETFGVSVRTIYRDIDAIDAAGIPIVSSNGVGGGFEIMDTYSLERQLFSVDDLLSILSTLKGVGNALGQANIQRTTQKVATLLPKVQANALSNELRIELKPFGDTGATQKTLERIQKALSERRCVRFTYLNSERQTSDREVEPMTLVFKGSAWYLFAFCTLKNDYRLFKISRIRNCVPQPRHFARRQKSYDEFAAESDRRAEQSLVHLALQFDSAARFWVEDTFFPNQITRRSKHHIHVAVSLPEGEWIYSWLLSFGGYVEVLSPKTVRQTLHDHAAALVKKNA